MLPMNPLDVWTKATEDHILQALITLGSLPTRQSDTADIDRSAYHIALSDVTRYGLSEAVKAILRGRLGHTFFPSPVELRQQCDKAMEPHIRQAERVRVRETQEQVRTQYARNTADRSPETKERVAAAYKRFCAGYEDDKKAVIENAEREAIRETYGMTPERLATIKDIPITATFSNPSVEIRKESDALS